MTKDQKDVLADVVVDPDAWDAHQRAHFIAKYGAEKGTAIADANLEAKVARWKPQFEQRKGRQDYKTRAQRDEIEKQNDKSIA